MNLQPPVVDSDVDLDLQEADELAGDVVVEHITLILVLVQVDVGHDSVHLQAQIVLATAQLALPYQVVLDFAVEAGCEDVVDHLGFVDLRLADKVYLQGLEVLLQTLQVAQNLLGVQLLHELQALRQL